MRSEPMRIALGLLAAAGVSAACVSATLSSQYALGLFDWLGKTLIGAGAFLVFSLPAAFLLGLPSFFLLKALGLLRWWTGTVAGVCAGAVVFLVFSYPGSPSFKGLSMFCAMGAVSGFVFWVIWRPSQIEVR